MFLNPKGIIVDFLLNRLTDPRARADDSTTDSFTATASQASFTLTPPSGTLTSVTSVTVNAVTKVKWRDYYIDSKNQKIIFFTGLSLNDAVVVTYVYGTTSWIYPDKPAVTIGAASFPRIRVGVISSIGKRLGNFEAPVEGSIHFQVDIWCKEKQIFTIGTTKYAGEDLAEYLAYQVIQAFEDYEDDIYPALYGYTPVGLPKDMPFDVTYQSHRKTIEFILSGIKIGRIS
ncbi:hypothetical protein GQ473_01125 [archaeon]|nr:hypothetical protein [archaeon]